MKHLILLTIIALTILLSGCTEIRYAKANATRAETQRTNDRHAVQMSDATALAPTRVAAKETIIWSGAISGVILLLALTGAGSYYALGLAYARVKGALLDADLIPLQRETRQFPLFTYEIKGVPRIYNANTGELLKLTKSQAPHPQLTINAGNTQLAGVIAEAGHAPGEALASTRVIEMRSQ